MLANLIGYKPYEFENEGSHLKGYSLFFALPDMVDIEGKGCTVAKVNYDFDKKKWTCKGAPIDFDENTLSVGANYDLVYKTGLDKNLNTVQKLVSIIRAK